MIQVFMKATLLTSINKTVLYRIIFYSSVFRFAFYEADESPSNDDWTSAFGNREALCAASLRTRAHFDDLRAFRGRDRVAQI